VALLEQHLQQDRLGVQRVDPLDVRGDETSTSGDKVRSNELQTIKKQTITRSRTDADLAESSGVAH
jgi:hypothetical protein